MPSAYRIATKNFAEAIRAIAPRCTKEKRRRVKALLLDRQWTRMMAALMIADLRGMRLAIEYLRTTDAKGTPK